MSVQWYYGTEGDRHGPYSAQELQALAAAGTIRPTDTVWKEGVAQGVAAVRVKNLFQPAGANKPGAAAPAASGPAATDPQASASPASQETVSAHKTVPAQTAAHSPDDSGTAADAASAQTDSAAEAGASNGSGPAHPAAAEAPDSEEMEPPLAPTKTPPPESPPKKLRATALRGASIVSQDGASVYFRKKCTECGTEETGRSRLPIRPGITRTSYFCRKCRKLRPVEIQGSG
ncbi:MAG TPA: GYF domain-containing protein [Gemmataceae bacterium]|nr:GYF domain-containing protein [Gemmataceae bacterium]